MHQVLQERQAGINRRAGFREPDRDHRFAELSARTHLDWFLVQGCDPVFFRAPKFIPHWIKNDADDHFTAKAKRDRNAKMWDAIKKIHGAIERIDHPLVLTSLIAHNSFLAVERVRRKLFEQNSRDQILRFDIDLELDVVGG